jgi:hypothetical protein
MTPNIPYPVFPDALFPVLRIPNYYRCINQTILESRKQKRIFAYASLIFPHLIHQSNSLFPICPEDKSSTNETSGTVSELQWYL